MGFKLEVGVDNNPIQCNNPMDYKLGYELAQSPILLYKRTFVISIVYKYKIFNIGKNYNDKNKRQLYKIF